ncbi:DUF72 domain-containing protein [Bacillus sp. HMF5848]|uniref:DUF72 domain-containing protein n=1 Tax=Bacillus sp. HMF5848 TaxID=2495421 RepID=UPI000F799F32|nr:DUF72 domain-containing protein [Bacillus sp. HMF5848]RSK28452.1 DUF72 domain-containing protein [Bacillus sp. HMF5848]
MIYVGVTGWGDHDSLYSGGISPRNKLAQYASHFPIVEVDSSFYAIPSQVTVEKWVSQTPTSFQFIVKAYQGMTGHTRGDIPFASVEEMFEVFKQSLQPFISGNKLAMILFQFPPWYDCTKEHVAYIRKCRQLMTDLPIALEFRHQSWFLERFRAKTLHMMQEDGWIHSICDEPQGHSGSIPTVLIPTDPIKTLVRFHGRNVHGWRHSIGANWRDVRYLYDYNLTELSEWASHLASLQKSSQHIYVLFNNNSGGHAVGNAKMLIKLLGIEYGGLAPKQLSLF